MYALIEIAGKQFKVEENVQLKIPYNSNKIGDKINFDKVLYFDDGNKKSVGNPYISGLSINAKVVSHGKDPKVIVFKLKRRKGYQKKNGHRQQYSVLTIGKLAAKKKSTTKKKAAPKKAVPKTKASTATKAKKTTVKKKD